MKRAPLLLVIVLIMGAYIGTFAIEQLQHAIVTQTALVQA
jgi:hypothetical protein